MNLIALSTLDSEYYKYYTENVTFKVGKSSIAIVKNSLEFKLYIFQGSIILREVGVVLMSNNKNHTRL